MKSIHPHVNALFDAYTGAMGIELALSPAAERWLLDAHNAGLDADGFKLAIKARLKFNFRGGFQRGITLHHFVRSEEDIAVTLNEAAVIRASMRVKVFAPNKAQALRDAGLPDAPPSPEAKHIADTAVLKAIEDLRKAAG